MTLKPVKYDIIYYPKNDEIWIYLWSYMNFMNNHFTLSFACINNLYPNSAMNSVSIFYIKFFKVNSDAKFKWNREQS